MDAIWGVLAQSPDNMVAVHIYIIKASAVLLLRKGQVYWIGWILHAPNSRMLTLGSKYVIDARIGG